MIWGMAVTAALVTAVPGPLPGPLELPLDDTSRIIRAMTLEEKVGQLFVLSVYGTRPGLSGRIAVQGNRRLYGVATAAQVLRRYRPGGVMYGDRNVESPGQVAGLSNGLQRSSKVPLLISVDQEGGGRFTRIGPPATVLPGGMALAAGRRPADAYAAASLVGRELRAMGIHQNYAPVADVNVNPANPIIGVRSFGSDPALAAEFVAAQVRGYQGAGVVATVKHFPGHGDTRVDSHTGLPVITHSRAAWERIDLPPFRAAIRAGTDSIMLGHLVFPALDRSRRMATVSKPIINGIIRSELGFRGVIGTDSLGMAGARQTHPDHEVPLLALRAGADQLLMPATRAFPRARRTIVNAVRSGRLSEDRLDQSVRRLLDMKARRGVLRQPYADVDAVGAVVGAPAHGEVAARIADRAVTLLKNADGLLPLGGSRRVFVTGAVTPPGAAALRTGANPSADAVAQAVARARRADVVVVTVSDAGAAQRRLVSALVRGGRPVVVAAVGSPYDVAAFSSARAVLATYSSLPVSLDALARVLRGEIAPSGRLPVEVPGRYRFGYGLST